MKDGCWAARGGQKIFGADQKHSMSSQLGHWAWSRDVGNDEFPVPTLSEVVLLCIFVTLLRPLLFLSVFMHARLLSNNGKKEDPSFSLLSRRNKSIFSSDFLSLGDKCVFVPSDTEHTWKVPFISQPQKVDGQRSGWQVITLSILVEEGAFRVITSSEKWP